MRRTLSRPLKKSFSVLHLCFTALPCVDTVVVVSLVAAVRSEKVSCSLSLVLGSSHTRNRMIQCGVGLLQPRESVKYPKKNFFSALLVRTRTVRGALLWISG